MVFLYFRFGDSGKLSKCRIVRFLRRARDAAKSSGAISLKSIVLASVFCSPVNRNPGYDRIGRPRNDGAVTVPGIGGQRHGTDRFPT